MISGLGHIVISSKCPGLGGVVTFSESAATVLGEGFTGLSLKTGTEGISMPKKGGRGGGVGRPDAEGLGGRGGGGGGGGRSGEILSHCGGDSIVTSTGGGGEGKPGDECKVSVLISATAGVHGGELWLSLLTHAGGVRGGVGEESHFRFSIDGGEELEAAEGEGGGVVPGSGGGGGGMGSLTVSEVVEEREVDEEDTEREDNSEDDLSGTLGLALGLGGFPAPGDLALSPEVVGVPVVGVFDWLE